MTRYEKLFKNLFSKSEGALIPFVILGDPSIELSLKIIDTLIKSGADALELGIPFSDPLADGLIIQKSIIRSLNAGIQISKCFEIIKEIRQKYLEIPIGLLIYANLILNKGIDKFYSKCAEIGVDSVLVIDVPIEESKPFVYSAKNYKISPIFICPPNYNNYFLYKISFYGSGYTYLMSRNGVTGIDKSPKFLSDDLINKLRKYIKIPLIQGFGISSPDHVKLAINSGLDGVICGSAIVNIIENFYESSNFLLKLKTFIQQLKIATYKTNL